MEERTSYARKHSKNSVVNLPGITCDKYGQTKVISMDGNNVINMEGIPR